MTLVMLVPVGMWLITVLVVALVKQARQAPDQHVGKLATCLASLRTLIPPTFAAMLLLGVIALGPLHRSVERWAHYHQAIIEQGDVQYWGIRAQPAMPTRATPAPGQ